MLFRIFITVSNPFETIPRGTILRHSMRCQNCGYIIDIWGILDYYLVFPSKSIQVKLMHIVHQRSAAKRCTTYETGRKKILSLCRAHSEKKEKKRTTDQFPIDPCTLSSHIGPMYRMSQKKSYRCSRLLE